MTKKKAKRRKKPDVGGPVEVVGSRSEWAKCGVEIAVLARTTGRDRVIRLRETISMEAKLPMPPIRIEPYGFMNNTGSGAMYGVMLPMVIKGSTVFAVSLPVATLTLIADDILLRRILCHEFAHCFWQLVNIYNSLQAGENKSDISGAKDVEQLVDPTDWFGPWDIKHFMPKTEDHVFDELDKRYLDEWVYLGRPTKGHGGGFSATNIKVEDEILEHIKKLHTFESR